MNGSFMTPELGRLFLSAPKVRQIVPPADMSRPITYFIGFWTEFVKIGKSTRERLAWRLKSMQVSCPVRLEVVCIEDAPAQGERGYHDKFKNLRARGEWFRAEGALLREMRGICDAMAAWDWFFCMELSGVFEDD